MAGVERAAAKLQVARERACEVLVPGVDLRALEGRIALAVLPLEAQLHAATPGAIADRAAGVASRVAAVARRDFAAEALLRGLAGDDVDDAADGVRTPLIASRPLDDLDALDGFERDVLECREAVDAVVEAHAVNQHQRVVALGTADEDRGRRLADAAAADDVDARDLRDGLADIVGLQQHELLARDHGHRGIDRRGRDRAAGGGDIDRVERHGIFGPRRQCEGGGGKRREKGLGGGVAKK